MASIFPRRRWELEGVDTEIRGEDAVRHREYTESTIRALAWVLLPRIQFTDSGHGIVFNATLHQGRKKAPKAALVHHVRQHLPAIMAKLRREQKS